MADLFYDAPGQDVAIASRVRLARNYQDAPFMQKMTGEWAEEIIRRAGEAMMNAPDATAYEGIRMRDLRECEQRALVEQRLISAGLCKSAHGAALISSGKTVTVMINEEDHLRVQGLLSGLQLDRAAELAFRADDALSRHGAYAFDAHLGYLTACPANAGTGMRCGVILHLPALQAAGQTGPTTANMAKIGVAMRALYAEGLEAPGGMYLLSNQATIGRSEEDIIRALDEAANQICAHERELREAVYKQDPLVVQDRVMRSVGILKNARILRLGEFFRHISDVRLACALGLCDAPIAKADEMIMAMQPGSLRSEIAAEATDRDIDILRADKMRAFMQEMRFS